MGHHRRGGQHILYAQRAASCSVNDSQHWTSRLARASCYSCQPPVCLVLMFHGILSSRWDGQSEARGAVVHKNVRAGVVAQTQRGGYTILPNVEHATQVRDLSNGSEGLDPLLGLRSEWMRGVGGSCSTSAGPLELPDHHRAREPHFARLVRTI